MGIKRRKKNSCCGHHYPAFQGCVQRSEEHGTKEALGKSKRRKRKNSIAYKKKVNCSKTTKHENTTREQAEAESKVQAEFRETSKN